MTFHLSTRATFLSKASAFVLLLSTFNCVVAEDETIELSVVSNSKQPLNSIKAILEDPSRLNFDESNRITLRALFEKVSAEHGLQIRVDKNLAAIFAIGRESMLVAEGEIPGASMNAPHMHGGIVSFSNPLNPAPVYSGSNFVNNSPQATQSTYASPDAVSLPNQAYLDSDATYLHPEQNENPQPIPATSPQPSAVIQLSGKDSQTEQPAIRQTNKPVVNSSNAEEADQIATIEQQTEADKQTLQLSSRVIEMLLETEISTVGLSQPEASLESVLEQALDHVTTLMDVSIIEGEMPIPFHVTRAYDLTLLVRDHHVLITTVASANLIKTTKVYSVSGLGEIDAETLAVVISKTIRPWSWRHQINDLVEQVSADWPDSVSIPKINIDLTGVSTVNAADETESDAATELDLSSLKTMGQLLSSGTIAAAHTLISGSEMLHYADPPTADIETLPGMLIITHSQAAHKEIDDLITQLKNAAD